MQPPGARNCEEYVKRITFNSLFEMQRKNKNETHEGDPAVVFQFSI